MTSAQDRTSGEALMVRGATVGTLVVTPMFAGVAYLLRGPHAAIAVLFAVGIVLANSLASAGVMIWVGKRWPLMAPAAGMPSYAIRMGVILVALAKLRNASFVDAPSFAITFGIAVVATLAIEAGIYKRTPWLARTFLNGGSGAATTPSND